MLPLSVPLYHVIFPVLVGTTTASRNALRLASPDMRVCSFTTTRRRRRRQFYAIYSQYMRADTYVYVCVCVRLLMRASFTRTHICPCIHKRSAYVGQTAWRSPSPASAVCPRRREKEGTKGQKGSFLGSIKRE